MNQIFLGQPSDYIKNWFITKFPYWPTYTTLEFVDGTTKTKEILGVATWQNIGVKSDQNSGNNTLKSCQLGKKVTEISGWAFSNCYSLTSVNIPSSISSIGEWVFFSCTSLTSISIPNSVISIGSWAFERCISLTSITVDPNNPRYDSRDNCNAIIETSSNTLIQGCVNTTIPNSVTSIGSEAFYYCSSLTSIDIPSSVTSIGSQAFYGCHSLTSVNIPSSISSIGDGAFAESFSLTSINIPSSVTFIGSYIFMYDSNLLSVVFEGRTMDQIKAMENYPWDIPNTNAIIAGIS